MHMRNAQLLQMVDACSQSLRRLCAHFGQRQELALIVNARAFVNGEISMMHLIDHRISQTLEAWLTVTFPTFRICLLHIYNSPAVSVHAHRLDEQSGRIAEPFLIHLHVECIELAHQVSVDFHMPSAVIAQFHMMRLISVPTLSLIIQHQSHLISVRTPQMEVSMCRRIFHFAHTPLSNRILFRRIIKHPLLLLASCHHHRYHHKSQ